jgi:hypothetical protein
MPTNICRLESRVFHPSWWIAITLFIIAPVAWGTGTDPELALTEVFAESGGGVRMVRLDGVFPADDLVQLPYPLHILIREQAASARYVRFESTGGVLTGTAPQLADGMSPVEAASLVGVGESSPDGGILFLGLGRLEVQLPASFPSGSAVAQLFAVEGGEAIVSNPFPFVLGGGSP